MSFKRPSLASLVDLSKATLSAKLGSDAPMLERTPEQAICNVGAALAAGVHGHLDYLQRQIFPETCAEDFLPAHAAAMRLPRKEGESAEAWRARLAAARRDPPSGGDAPDFIRWAMAVPGVARAWVVPCWQGLGTVGVIFAPAGDYDEAHALALRAAVQSSLDAQPPIGVERSAIVAQAVELHLELALEPNTGEAQQAVISAIRDHLREAQPGAPVVLSKLDAAISAVDGLIDHQIISPSTNIALPPLSLPVLGGIDFFGA